MLNIKNVLTAKGISTRLRLHENCDIVKASSKRRCPYGEYATPA